MATTENLISEYNARMAVLWNRCVPGSTRAASRQAKIDALVSEISTRADNGDPIALAWYDI